MSFRRFFLIRLAWAVLALWLALTTLFVVTRVFTLRPVDFSLFREPADAYRRYVAALRLDDPVHERYARFLEDTTTQDFGRSAVTDRGARATVVQALPATLSLVFPALALAVLAAWGIAIALRHTSPLHPYRWRVPVAVAIGIPPFMLGLWLSYIGFKSGALPITGYCDFFNPPSGSDCGGPADWAEHLILPWLTIGLFFTAVYARVLRVWMKDIARSSGETRSRLARRARGATARLVGRDVGLAISLAVFVESTFSIPGIGRGVVVYADQYDFRLVEAAIFYACAIAIGVHFLVDVIVGAVDRDLRAEWPVAGMPVRT